jgi:hypothetical protein
MSASYKLYGEMGLRNCPEVVATIQRLKSEFCPAGQLEVREYEPGVISLVVDI